MDYPPICIAVGRAVAEGRADRGIVLGGSGQGEQIAANKVAGVRAALCNDLYTARLSREHNDANVLSMGGRIVAVRPRRRNSRRSGSTRRSTAAVTSAASIRSRDARERADGHRRYDSMPDMRRGARSPRPIRKSPAPSATSCTARTTASS